jgi:hypothetical protein
MRFQASRTGPAPHLPGSAWPNPCVQAQEWLKQQKTNKKHIFNFKKLI